MRGRIVIGVSAALAVLLVATQLLIPPIAGSRIEDRLTENGGTASASVSAFPALRLLFGDGGTFEARGTGLDLQREPDDPVVFDKLDGFGKVDVQMTDSRVGPFEISTFELTRGGDEPYTLRTQGSTTGAELANFAAGQVGLPSGPLVQFFANQLPGGTVRVPIDADMRLESDGGRISIVSGGTSVAGIPVGPLAELITSVIVVRL